MKSNGERYTIADFLKRTLRIIFLLLAVALMICPVSPEAAVIANTKQPALHGFPIQGTPHHGVFESNHGQFPDAVKFVARNLNYSAYFGLGGVNFISRDGSDLRLDFSGSAMVLPEGASERPGKVHYIKGSDPTKWQSSVPIFSTILYREIYRGIDLVFYFNGQEIAHDWVVAPGADPSVIRTRVTGARISTADPDGSVVLKWPEGSFRIAAPVAYQDFEGARRPVPVKFAVRRNTLTFDIAPFDREHTLVIDPTVEYATLLGGTSGSDWGEAVTIDSTGDVYIAGHTTSSNLPTSQVSIQPRIGGGGDFFIARFTSEGQLVFLTFLGGSANETHRVQIAVDANGVYIVGGTRSTNYPTTPDAHQRQHRGGDWDAVFSKISLDGSNLLYSTFLGGARDDRGFGLALAGDRVLVAGRTSSVDFPAVGNQFQTEPKGGVDAFVAAFENEVLVATTLLGGAGDDSIRGVAAASQGDVYVAGDTTSADFPTTDTGFQKGYGGSGEVFVARLSRDLSNLVFSTYLGGGALEFMRAMTLRPDGEGVVVGGFTDSSDFPTSAGSIAPTPLGGTDAFISQISATGELDWSTRLGGSRWEEVGAVAFDAAGDLWMAGSTDSVNFPLTTIEYQASLGGGKDAFIASTDPNASELKFSVYLGGRYNDWYWGLATGGDGSIWAVGGSASADFPTTPDAFQQGTNSGAFEENAIIVKIMTELPQPAEDVVPSFTWTPRAPVIGSPIRFENRSEHATGWHWSFGDGSTSIAENPEHTYEDDGLYSVILTASNDAGARSLSKEITVTEETTHFSPHLIVPGQARAEGVAGSYFRSAFWMTNMGTDASLIRLRFVPAPGGSFGGGEELATFTLRERRSFAFDDILTEAFGANSDTAGVVVVETAEGSPVPIVTTRTYNDRGIDGSLGQYIAAVMLAPIESDAAIIEGLSSDDASRSNVGVVNLSPLLIQCDLTVFDESGTKRGNDVVLHVPAHSAIQVNGIANTAGAGSHSLFSVRFSASGPFFAYASKLDNRTSDPIFVPGTLAAHSIQHVDGVGAVTGAGGTRFRSNLIISNRNAVPAEVEIAMTPRGDTAPTQQANLTVPAGGTVSFEDAVRELYGIEGAGAIRITTNSSTPVVAWARTYSDLGTNGTLGQFIPGFATDDLIPTTGAILQGLSQNQRYRTNLGLVNVAQMPVEVTISAWSIEGVKEGEKTWNIESGQSVFVGAILREITGGDLTNSYLVITPSAPASIYAWASFVDNISTDQTFVRPVSY